MSAHIGYGERYVDSRVRTVTSSKTDNDGNMSAEPTSALASSSPAHQRAPLLYRLQARLCS